MMPAYEANVLEKFAEMLDRGMVSRGSRPVFWSVNQQRILSEDDFSHEIALKDSLVTKMPIAHFGPKAEKI